VLGNRNLRTAYRAAVSNLTDAGIPANKVGIMVSFATTKGFGGRSGLEPVSAWYRVAKWQALAAQQVAARVADMARRSYLNVVGVIENMSAFAAPDGSRHAIFGEGGGAALADEIGVPLLGRIPLDPVLREAADEGNPVLEVAPESEVAQAIAALAEAVAATRGGTIRKPLTVLG
jgi:hypothetical protein